MGVKNLLRSLGTAPYVALVHPKFTNSESDSFWGVLVATLAIDPCNDPMLPFFPCSNFSTECHRGGIRLQFHYFQPWVIKGKKRIVSKKFCNMLKLRLIFERLKTMPTYIYEIYLTFIFQKREGNYWVSRYKINSDAVFLPFEKRHLVVLP